MNIDDEDKITHLTIRDMVDDIKKYKSEDYPNGKDRYGDPWIREAVMEGAYRIVDWMISEGSGVDLKSLVDEERNDGHTLLTLAVDQCVNYQEDELDKFENVIRSLVKAGCDINEPGWQLMPPLHYALFTHNERISKLLLSLGADPNVKCIIDNMGTAYDVAKEERMEHVFS